MKNKTNKGTPQELRLIQRRIEQLHKSVPEGKGRVETTLLLSRQKNAPFRRSLFLPYVRQALCKSIVESNLALERLSGKTRKAGARNEGEEIVLRNKKIWLYLEKGDGGSSKELVYIPARVNLFDVMPRYRPQRRVRAAALAAFRALFRCYNGAYDKETRSSLRERLLQGNVTPLAFAQGRGNDILCGGRITRMHVRGRTARLTRQFSRRGITIVKTVRLAQGRAAFTLEYMIINGSSAFLRGRFGIEHNIALKDFRFNRPDAIDGLAKVVVEDREKGLRYVVSPQKKAVIWHFPVETLSLSQARPMRVYQGLCMYVHWPIAIAPGARWRCALTVAIEDYGDALL